jgi:hypothetical protein
LKKLVKPISYFLGGVLLLFLITFAVLSIYVSTHKEELIAKATQEISSTIGGTASVADLSVSFFKSFPSLSIDLQNLDIRDSAYARHRHKLLSLANVFLRVNPLKLAIGKIALTKIELESGSVYIYTDSSGYSNDYLLKGRSDKSAKPSSETTEHLFDKITLKNISATVNDLSKNKLFDIVIKNLVAKTKQDGDLISILVSESIFVKSLAFNTKQGSYLANHSLIGNYTLFYNTTKKELSFDSIRMLISKQPFNLTGSFAFGKKQSFSLKVKTDQLGFVFAKSLLTPKTAAGISIVSLEGPLDIAATLNGSLNEGDPLVVANWTTRNNTLTTPLLNFDSCSFTGMYTNEVVAGKQRNDSNSKVEAYSFTGNWRGLNMRSEKIVLNNLTTPILEATLLSDFSLAQLNAVLQTESLVLNGGLGKMNLHYKGPVDYITPQNASLNGSVVLTRGNLVLQPSQANLSNCNGSIHFINADLVIDSLVTTISKNPIYFSGEAKNVLALLGESPGGLSLTLNAHASLLNIDHLSSILLRKLPSNKTAVKQKNKGRLSKSVEQIDGLLSNGSIAVNISADRLQMKNFEGSRLKANILIDQNAWQIKQASLQQGAGSLSVVAKATTEDNNHFKLNASIDMKNLDARKIWYGFNNFGVPALSYQNIRGVLSSRSSFSMLIDKSGNFDLGSLSGNADFSIKKGALINFKPLQSVESFLVKNRNLADISFAEIKDYISFNKGEIRMGRMEINSSVLSLFVEGVYNTAGKTDIRIQVPVSNLKKRGADYKPENLGAGRSGGMSVFLRAISGEDGKIKLKYDLLGRFRKTVLDTAINKKNP